MSFLGKHFLEEASSPGSEFLRKLGSIFPKKLGNVFFEETWKCLFGEAGNYFPKEVKNVFPRKRHYKGICFLDKCHFGEIISPYASSVIPPPI
jgi:hypothetical protein